MNNLIRGISAYFEAFGMIRRHGWWNYVLLPGLVSLIFGGLVVAIAWKFSAVIGLWLLNIYPWEWGAAIFAKIVTILGIIIIIAPSMLVYRTTIFTLVSPWMSVLSEKVENAMTGKTETVELYFWTSMVRGLRISLRLLAREILLTFFLFLFSWIPVIGQGLGLLIPLVQAYYAGFANLDYMMERHFGVRGSIDFVHRHRSIAIGNGAGFLLLLLVPVLGLFLAPALSTVAATIVGTEALQKEIAANKAIKA